MRDSFSKMHPLVNFTFFAAVIAFSMFLMQPVCLGISFLCALSNAIYLSGKKTAVFSLKILLPMTVLILLVNPLFNHKGATVLGYFPWGNPLTLESVLYGAASAVLLCSVALWFSCLNRVMTSDKILYLFGKLAPALSLVLSMTLRFIPRFTAQLRLVRQAQKQTYGCGSRSITVRFKAGLRVLSVMISWSLESAVETSDSMKSRGYGLKGRTAFSIYRFHKRDAVTLSLVSVTAAALLTLVLGGQMSCRYFPAFRGNLSGGSAILFYCLYAALMLTPMMINIGEGIRWKRLQSSI